MNNYTLLSNPDDLLKKITDYLPLTDAVSFCSVSKRLRTLLFRGNRFQFVLHCEEDYKSSTFSLKDLPYYKDHKSLLANIEKFLYCIEYDRKKEVDELKEVFLLLPKLRVVVAAALQSATIHPTFPDTLPPTVTSLELVTQSLKKFKLQNLPSITSLKLYWFDTTDKIQFPPRVESLVLEAPNASNFNLRQLALLPLRELKILLTFSNLSQIPTTVEVLTIQRITETESHHLLRLSQLQELNCEDCTIDASSFPTSLTRLNYSSRYSLSPAFPTAFPPTLKTLELKIAKFGGLPPLPPNLSKLILHVDFFSDDEFTGEMVPKTVTSLSLYFSSSASIGKCVWPPNLQELILNRCHIKKKYISDLPLSLTFMHIYDMYVSRSTVEKMIELLAPQQRTIRIQLVHPPVGTRDPKRTHDYFIHQGKKYHYVKQVSKCEGDSEDDDEGEFPSDFSTNSDEQFSDSSVSSRESKRRKIRFGDDEDWNEDE